MRGAAAIIALAAAFMLAGCATPINWPARVGVYTQDQAIIDYGPPGKAAKLTDGSMVDEWMTDRGAVIVTPEPYIYGPGYYGRGYVGPVGGGYSSTYFPARFLRLQFGPDGKLKAWKEFSK